MKLKQFNQNLLGILALFNKHKVFLEQVSSTTLL